MAQAPRKTKKQTEASENPNTRSLEWQSMSYKWWLMNTCFAGTSAMRDAGQLLLPKHSGETPTRYQERIETAVFTNFTRLTIEFLVGKPFSEKCVFRDGTPQSVLDLQTDIDGQGNDLTTVCMDFFQKGFAKGWSWGMVEFPDAGDGPKTMQTVKDLNLRPYWCIIPADNVISARGMILDGKWEWTHVRIMRPTVETDGFSEGVVNYIWLYELINQAATVDDKPDYKVRLTVYAEEKPNSNKWVVSTAAKMLSTSRIPLVRFNSTPDGEMQLEDLLYLNVKHWQSDADQASALIMARFPILAGSGIDQEKTYVIGPYELLTTSDPVAKFYYVENNGTALGVGDKDIHTLEDRMAMYGANMLKKKPDRQTATSSIIDTTENMAPLQIMVLQFMSALELMVDFTLMWLEDPAYEDTETYGIDVNLDFALSKEQEKQMSFFENARLQGDVSRAQFFAVGKELGYVPDAFNPTENETQLKAERAEDQAFQLSLTAAKGVQGNAGSGTGDPLNNPNDPKIKRSNTPAV